jgi:hypothetical protein
MIPYYIHPGTFPPFSYFPHGATPYPPGGPPPPSQSLETTETQKKADKQPSVDGAGVTVEPQPATPTTKKRTKAVKNGEPKVKKTKAASQRLQTDSKNESAEGGGENPAPDNVEDQANQNGA